MSFGRLSVIDVSLTFADVFVDLLSGRVTRAGRSTSFRSKELRILLRLCADAPDTVLKYDLAIDVLGRPYDPMTNTLEVQVSRMREALGEPLRSPILIVTRPYGYSIPHPVTVYSSLRGSR